MSAPEDRAPEAKTPEAKTPGAKITAGRRGTFAPVVAAGLGSTALLALAGYKPHLTVPEDQQRLLSTATVGEVRMELVGACALVALAAWGVLLVVRGKVRQAMCAIAALAAGGSFATIVVAGFVQRDQAAESLAERLGLSALGDQLPVEATGWLWLALVASVGSVMAAVAALMLAPEWPEMGSRYDAPTARAPQVADTPPEERTSLDLWKSMDEGEDPTDESSP
ncbi:Trp biosynthesis-associated membrane protein [Nocardioides stalactiti]|uniref:Trp biosynthesis-associated membrane protein n=1 Tax=Nocardioides stalactiti TaxID=2755356 RepID=UPI001603D5E2|nr:Trp biosynthesis-associated membrane protein [Nocardioides stalactiti]